jgi:hypothetical protein
MAWVRERTIPTDDSVGGFRENKAFGFQGKYGCKAETQNSTLR